MSQLRVPVGATDHTQGSAGAAVTLVEYGDFECPYCGAAYPVLKELQRRMGDDLRFVFRSFPLAQVHPHAVAAAEAAEAAGAQGQFWQMHDVLYEHQTALGLTHLRAYANRLKLDEPRFARDLEGHAFRARVEDDFRGGVRSGVNGTPTLFVNGTRYDGALELEAVLASLQTAARRKIP
jgi:protein-disulfide isomerase